MITSSGMTATHKGWMLFCPVYMNLNKDCPDVEARLAILEPLLSAATWFQGLAVSLLSLMNPHYVPAFRFRITGELP